MDATKRIYKNLERFLVYTWLLLFPFGQLIRFNFNIGLLEGVDIHPIDVLALGSYIFLVFKKSKPKIFNNGLAFVGVSVFSLILSSASFSLKEVIIGSLYLVRFFSYFSLFVLTWNLVRDGTIRKETLLNTLLIAALFAAILGWLQYIWLPDLTSLKYIGWDDHLNRLVGTFLDPGYAGIIFVLGTLISLYKLLKERKVVYILVSLFLIISTGFTYSRAAFLALFAGIITLVYLRKNLKLFLIIIILALATAFLPRPQGEGVRIERTASVITRIAGYRETFDIFTKNPLIGVGFNNICSARMKLNVGYRPSHSCYGSDSGFLLILTTTGIVGFLIFLNLVRQIFKYSENGIYKNILITILITLAVNGNFINSFFYPWVMGYVAIILALAIKE